MSNIWKNNKIGKFYWVRKVDTIDATNLSMPTIMVSYHDITNLKKEYVRASTEFFDKFAAATDDEVRTIPVEQILRVRRLERDIKDILG